jgi:hypothetical protein
MSYDKGGWGVKQEFLFMAKLFYDFHIAAELETIPKG